MTTVSGASNSSTQTSLSSQQGLMANYELFLNILTAQIQAQDPLDPMDSAQFTSQLVEYSNVEQAIQQNKNLESIISSLSTNMTMGYVSYIGNDVTVDASTTNLSGGSASWKYDLAEDASGTYEIRNSTGDVVYKGEADLKKGEGTLDWNGRSTAGADLPNGLYTISFDMKDAASNKEPVKTQYTGRVDRVDLSGSEVLLSVGGREIPVSSVLSVAMPS